jgi:predicted nucleic acid-binding protein
MDITELPYPTLAEFEQYGTTSRARRIYIGREFLKFRHHEDPTDDVTITKRNYVDAFFDLVTNVETPFREIHTTQSTLSEVVIWLQRNQSEAAAENCLNEAMSDGPIAVSETPRSVLEAAADAFLDDSPKEPNFGEYLDHAAMNDSGIEHILTWDSDFCGFSGSITLLPHSMWNV